MMFKTPAIALYSCSPCSNLPAFVPTSPTCITSSRNSHIHPPLRRRPSHGRQFSKSLKQRGRRTASDSPSARIVQSTTGSEDSRNYANVSNGPSKSRHEPSSPHKWPTASVPTPYEIFDQKRETPYSKARFYELVKIYHPDRHRISTAQPLTHTVRLERYRLIVAANEILSDPVKRRAYDLYGAGWSGKPSIAHNHRAGDKSWREEPGNPSMNATWEDWERWYGQRNGEKTKQSPLYTSNELFVAILCVVIVIGSLGQARRASNHTMTLVELRDQKHEAVSADLRKRKDEQAMLDRHGRVESFLRSREGWNVPSSSSRGSSSPVPASENT